jgi:tetratricopeptide (TPR) repeat protein
MKPHVFVAMPFGVKQEIDFDRVYAELIAPALSDAGYRIMRADEELSAGSIRSDMFQELLLADLVVADLSLDNPNVWYELGVRHALRARGVIQIAATARERMPFDVYTDRTLRYHLAGGAPDPARLAADRQALTDMARATLARWHGDKISPVYHLLPALPEPDWKRLLVAGRNEFNDALQRWCQRIEVARRRNRPGDILVLADETPTWALRIEAQRLAGRALMQLGQYRLALDEYETALALDPDDLESNRQKGTLLGRLGRPEQAREHIEALLETHADDPDTWCLLGRVEKDEWVSRWRLPGAAGAQLRAYACAELALLDEAIQPYLRAFVLDADHVYSGINAVTLRHLQRHLCGAIEDPDGLAQLEGGVSWACRAALARAPKDYWARASHADLLLLLADADTVARAYAHAAAAAGEDGFALDSTRQQLLLLRDLEFRPDVVARALEVVERELARHEPPFRPRQVLLFSGHMLDKTGRAVPRFPPEREAAAAQAIAAKLDELGAGPGDLALCGGACGGDILFAEACLARGLQVQIHIQYAEPAFLAASVAFAGPQWVERYYRLKAQATLCVQPDELGPVPEGADAYERNNLWQLYTALSFGPERVRFIALWDGREGEGAGGTRHMVDTVRRHAGLAYILDTNTLW